MVSAIGVFDILPLDRHLHLLRGYYISNRVDSLVICSTGCGRFGGRALGRSSIRVLRERRMQLFLQKSKLSKYSGIFMRYHDVNTDSRWTARIAASYSCTGEFFQERPKCHKLYLVGREDVSELGCEGEYRHRAAVSQSAEDYLYSGPNLIAPGATAHWSTSCCRA